MSVVNNLYQFQKGKTYSILSRDKHEGARIYVLSNDGDEMTYYKITLEDTKTMKDILGGPITARVDEDIINEFKTGGGKRRRKSLKNKRSRKSITKKRRKSH